MWPACECIHSHSQVMKVDVEGFEPQVLQGAMSLFRNNKVDHVLTEFNKVRGNNRIIVWCTGVASASPASCQGLVPDRGHWWLPSLAWHVYSRALKRPCMKAPTCEHGSTLRRLQWLSPVAHHLNALLYVAWFGHHANVVVLICSVCHAPCCHSIDAVCPWALQWWCARHQDLDQHLCGPWLQHQSDFLFWPFPGSQRTGSTARQGRHL